MSVRKLDEINVSCFINRGPYLDNADPSKLFSSANLLGSPMEMEIHSSIDSFYRYGYILFYDESGVRESFPLTGNEIISLVYHNTYRTTGTVAPTIIHFNIFDIEEVARDPAAFESKRFTGKILKFHLIESPFFLKYNERTWKTAFGSDAGDGSDQRMYIHDIFTSHFTDHLKLIKDDPKKNIIETNFSKMSSKLHFVSPAWKTQRLLTYMLEFARDTYGYGNVKCFTTTNNESGRPIVNLISLNQLFRNDANKQVINFVLTNDADIIGKPQTLDMRALNQILLYKFLSYDLSSVPNGFAGGHLLNYDYKSGQFFTQYDNYEESNKRKENSYFSNFGLWSNTISNENSKQYYYGPLKRDEAQQYLNNKITKEKYQLRCEVMTYVDELIYPGQKIVASFPSGMAEATREKQTHLLDEHMSDEWIVQDIVDGYKDGRGLRKMVIVKDSFFNIYGKSDGAADFVPPVPQVQYVNNKGNQ